MDRALAAGAHPIWPEAADNVAFDWTDGDAAAVDAAMRGAAHVARVRLHDTRLAPSALEPRAAIGQWDEATQRYTLTASTQGVAVVRRLLAEGVFKIPPSQLRVVTPDVGGGFGMKVQAYPEYAALLFAARRVGRPVKWRATRVESFLADTHGRDGMLEGELALDATGRFLALRVRTRVGIGAYVTAFAAVFGTNNTKNCLSSVYRIPAIAIDVTLAFTNAAPLGPYRGAGRPEALYLIERLIDQAAAATGVDRVELRRRNLIPAAAMPYPHAQRPHLRQRRVRDDHGPGAGPGRLAGVPAAARGLGAGRTAARHRPRLLPGGRGRHPRRGRGAALRRRRHRGAPHRGPADGPGPPLDVPLPGRGAARHRRRPRCASCRATATWCRPARPASPRAP